MLPRGLEFVRLLQVRQRLVGRTITTYSCYGRGTQSSLRALNNFYVHKCAQTRLLKSQNIANSLPATNGRRFYAKKEKVAAQTVATTSTSTSKNVEKDAETKKAVATPTTATSKTNDSETIIIANATETLKASPATSTTPAATTITSASASPSPTSSASSTSLPKKIKKFELATPKGILSITTTIEDSKINEIIFEKTKPKTLKMDLPSVKICSNEVKDSLLKTKNEKTTTQLLAETTATPEQPALLKVQQQIREKIQAVAAAAMPTTKIESMPQIPIPPPSKTITPTTKQTANVITTATAATTTATATAATVAAAATAVTTKLEEKPIKPPKPIRVRLDLNRSSLERNFITPTRAMSDFLLKPADLETLTKIKRRSPYEQEPPMTVFWRKDVEGKAIEVWGSRENLLKETLKREVERKKHQQNIFTVKRRLRDYRREVGARTLPFEGEPGLMGHSGKVVLTAIGINCVNFLFKVGGWLYSGSHSMFAESIHSLADTVNQIILAYGIHKSFQSADSDHPYGYSNMRYVSALISGVGIFCVGSGLSIYHGITGLMDPHPPENFFWAFFILGGSFVSEGATLLVATNELKRAAKLRGISFKEYVLSGKDPCVNVVLAEDFAAVSSVFVAVSCMGLTSLTGSPVFDAVGSLLVGGILGCVASFIIYSNAAALVGKSISEEQLNKINAELESDVMIRAIHDVKGIDIGSALVRYKAELDFDGRELTRSYLDKQDLGELLKIVKSFQTSEELEAFLLAHGENIVDLMGGEIDRIEMKLRKKFPEIRHCDLEIL